MLATLVAVVVAAVAGTTVGYAALSKDVTLTLDGRTTQVSAIGDTVGDVLAAEGIDLTDKDLVAPAVDESITDGSAIAVQFGRPLELSVDGETQHATGSTPPTSPARWARSAAASTAPTCPPAAAPRSAARASPCRSSPPRSSRIKLGAQGPAQAQGHRADRRRRARVDGLRGRQARQGHPVARPPRSPRATRSSSRTSASRRRRSQREVVDAPVIEREDPTMYEGEEEVVRAGSDGVRNVTYRLRFVNGELVARKVVDADVRVKAVPTIVAVGTKEQPHQQLRRRQHRLGLPGAVRVRRQLGHQHRQRLLRRPPVQPRHLACLRRHRLPAPGLPRDPDRRRHPAPRRHRRLRLVARLRGQARPAPLTSPPAVTPG